MFAGSWDFCLFSEFCFLTFHLLPSPNKKLSRVNFYLVLGRIFKLKKKFFFCYFLFGHLSSYKCQTGLLKQSLGSQVFLKIKRFRIELINYTNGQNLVQGLFFKKFSICKMKIQLFVETTQIQQTFMEVVFFSPV